MRTQSQARVRLHQAGVVGEAAVRTSIGAGVQPGPSLQPREELQSRPQAPAAKNVCGLGLLVRAFLGASARTSQWGGTGEARDLCAVTWPFRLTLLLTRVHQTAGPFVRGSGEVRRPRLALTCSRPGNGPGGRRRALASGSRSNPRSIEERLDALTGHSDTLKQLS